MRTSVFDNNCANVDTCDALMLHGNTILQIDIVILQAVNLIDTVILNNGGLLTWSQSSRPERSASLNNTVTTPSAPWDSM